MSVATGSRRGTLRDPRILIAADAKRHMLLTVEEVHGHVFHGTGGCRTFWCHQRMKEQFSIFVGTGPSGTDQIEKMRCLW